MKCPLFEKCEDACHDCLDVADSDCSKEQAIMIAKENCFTPKKEVEANATV